MIKICFVNRIEVNLIVIAIWEKLLPGRANDIWGLWIRGREVIL